MTRIIHRFMQPAWRLLPAFVLRPALPGARRIPPAAWQVIPKRVPRQNNDLAVTNVKWEPATEEYSYVTFDLSWSYSWRAKWTEPADKNVTGNPLELRTGTRPGFS